MWAVPVTSCYSQKGYNPIPYNNFNLSNQLLTPPGSDPSYSPDQNEGVRERERERDREKDREKDRERDREESYYNSPEQHQQQLHQESLTSQLSYNQCMQGEAIPTTTVIHQPLSHHPSQQQQQQQTTTTNLSPVNQVSPQQQQQVSPPGSSSAAMTSNLATSANLQLFMRSMQGGFANVTPDQQQRLLLQESEARRLSHINSIAAAGYSQTLPTTLELSSTRKKRKMGSPSNTQQTQPIKSEPGKTQPEHDYSDADQETNSENYRSLPWTEYNREKWARMLDMSGQPIDGFKYTVSADKGFVHSEAHAAFVSQKKNHVQVTVSAYGVIGAKYLKVENGLEGIRGFQITLHGFKNENKDHQIPINQSTVERQKYSLDPQRVEFQSGSLTKTIPRLHFSATTENNMRKKGKPNPNQSDGFKYTVSADKGFVHSEAHAAFVSQKKNHFQVTVSAYGVIGAKYLKVENGLEGIRGFQITLHGFKNENKDHQIPINQSTVERQKYSLDPQRVEFQSGSLTKTIPRLHFSATTLLLYSFFPFGLGLVSIPDQVIIFCLLFYSNEPKFFSLVVSLNAETNSGKVYPVAICISDRIIVRASSPSNFDLEQQLWERVDASSIRYMGNVGINMERPEHATLAVGGNLLVSGNINQYSDRRVKENIRPASTAEELNKVKQLNLYKYQYTEEFSKQNNIDVDEPQFGVIAQEVQNILPDAVKRDGGHGDGDASSSTSSSSNLLTVNKDRIYMAGVGAVKELSGITDDIIEKIDHLEQVGNTGSWLTDNKSRDLKASSDCLFTWSGRFLVNTGLVDRFKRKFGSKSTLNSNFTKCSRKQKSIFSSTVMHHNANIVTSHHPIAKPSDNKSVPVPPTDSAEQTKTVVMPYTYGPSHTPPPPIHPDIFDTANCDITQFPGLSSSKYELQYSQQGKRYVEVVGNVGINMERPEHATLAVGGNLLVSGNINQYSDRRVKGNIRPASTAEELNKVKQLNLYKYQYTEEFSKQNNIDVDEPQFGVIAQEVQNILPDAVKRDGGHGDGDASSSTSSSSNLLTVNKDRIYMAGVGAVKELSGITDDIIEKIDHLEQVGNTGSWLTDNKSRDLKASSDCLFTWSGRFLVNTGLVDRFKRKFGSKSTLNSNFTKCSRKQKSIFSSTDSLKSDSSVRKSLRMMQKAVCALSGVVILCLAAVICMFVVMHHNANIVTSHHPIAKPSDNKSVPVPPTDSAEQTKTVVMPYTYGPSHTPPPPIHPDIFDTANCDITQFPGLSSSKYELQYSQQGKRLDCKYTVSLSVEEYAILTNKNYLTVDIVPGQSGVKSQRCQFKSGSCTTSANGNNIFMSNHSPLNHTAIEALQGKATRNSPTKQLTGQKQEFTFYLVSGISKITSRIRLLPSSASCHECCHVSGGEYLDVHYSFTFTCPKDNKDNNSLKSDSSVRKSLRMMQKAVCALSGVVILCLAAVICMFVVMHHNANIVTSHHPIAKPSDNKSVPVPPTDSAEQTKTVVMPYTYGPSHTPPPPIHPDIFDTANCDITQFPGLSSSKYELQYSQQGKRLDCKYTVSLSVEEYAILTNKNYLTVDIVPGQSGVKSQRCQFKSGSCTTSANGNNIFMSNHSPLNHTAIEALQGKATRNSPTKQLTGQKQEFTFYLVSGISKITSRIRLLPSSASCHECCHVSGGEYLDVHYSFTFTCPKDNKDNNQVLLLSQSAGQYEMLQLATYC
eukprot:sb/3460708/